MIPDATIEAAAWAMFLVRIRRGSPRAGRSEAQLKRIRKHFSRESYPLLFEDAEAAVAAAEAVRGEQPDYTKLGHRAG